MAGDGGVGGLPENLDLGLVADDLRDRGKAEREGIFADQSAADAVDRPDPRAQKLNSLRGQSLLQQTPTDAFAQFLRRLHGEGRGQNGFGLSVSSDGFFLDHAREAKRLAGSGGGGDDVDAVQGLDHIRACVFGLPMVRQGAEGVDRLLLCLVLFLSF